MYTASLLESVSGGRFSLFAHGKQPESGQKLIRAGLGSLHSKLLHHLGKPLSLHEFHRHINCMPMYRGGSSRNAHKVPRS